MDQHLFLSRILPALPTPDTFGNAPVYFALGLGSFPNQKPCSSIQSVINHCMDMSNTGQDAYMALGSFSDPLQGRKQFNAYEYRCLWADIDAGKPTSKYQNANEALEALVNFSKKTGLLANILVSSGNGLHAYWTLDRNIPVTIWSQMAGLFYRLCQQEGLDVDPSRAVEAASVLRLPETIHQKTQRPVSVLWHRPDTWTPTEFVRALQRNVDPSFVPPVAIKTYSKPPATMSSSANLFGMGPEPPTAKAEPIVRNCMQILTSSRGPYQQRWNAMPVLRRCVDGLEWAHKLSQIGTGTYDPAMTDKKFFEAAEDAPTRCSTFELTNPALCAKCKYKGRVVSPVQLSKFISTDPVPPPTPVVADANSGLGLMLGHKPRLVIPQGWSYPNIAITHPRFLVDHRGIVMITTTKDANNNLTRNEEVICDTQLYFKYSIYEMGEANRPQRSYVFEAIHQNQMTQLLRLVVDTDMNTQGILRWFNNGNMYPTSGAYSGKVFMDFMSAYLGSVVPKAMELPTIDTFGWNEFTEPSTKQKKLGFVVGTGIITDTGMHEVNFGTQNEPHVASFSTKGTLDEWKHVPKMYGTLKQPIGQLAIGMSFAAPLMKYGSGEARNAVFSIWSAASGLGKSQLLRACASIWGNPERLFFSRQESPVARARRLAIWKNLPALMDELTDVKDEDMYGLAYTLTGGKEKNKLKSSGDSFVVTGDWSTCTITSANRSFKEIISKHAGDSEATLLRLMEYECDFPSYEKHPQVQEYINKCMALCQDNYGHAGPEFMYQLLQHPDRIVTLTAQAEHWTSIHGFANKERFMAYPLFLALKALRWAVEFDILDYDVDALEEWVLNVFVPHNRESTSSWTPDFANHLKNYLNERLLNTIVVAHMNREANEQDAGRADAPDKYILLRPRNEIKVRIHHEENIIYISKADFDAWCRLQKMSPLVVRRHLANLGINMNVEQKSLGKNISWLILPRIRCYVLTEEDVNALGYFVDVSSVENSVAAQVENLNL